MTPNGNHAAALDPRNWRETLSGFRREPENSRILGGSLLMLVGSGLVSLINFGYNIAVARMLGPAAFGHAAAAVTLFMVLSAITLAYQLVCAKFVAKNETAPARSAVYQSLRRRAWFVGIALGAAMLLASSAISSYLNLPDHSIVVLLALGVAFYIPLGVKRGGLQGVCAFSRLTANFVVETLIKFTSAVVLVHAGFGVHGAVSAISISVVAAYFIPPVTKELDAKPVGGIPASFREGIQAIVFFVGQVIINNVDILLVKHFFDAQNAGMYAAVALVGRVVYLLGWSVVSAMFPISAGSKTRAHDTSVLVVPLVLVLSIALFFTAGLNFFPGFALQIIFGDGFQNPRINALLSLYAASTGIYALSVVLIAFEMSRRLAVGAWVQLGFSAAIVLGINFFHATLRQVVVVQLVLMVGLLIASALPFFRKYSSPAIAEYVVPIGVGTATLAAPRVVKRIRRVAEAELIAAFLKNEFYHREFDKDRERFQDVVNNPDTTNEVENALRRSLLFRRRDTMWREIPDDTQWWQLELTRDDLDRIYVFPRAQWRRVANGNFLLRNVAEQMRRGIFAGTTRRFVQRVMALSSRLRRHNDDSMVMLIATDDTAPMTLIEGNHRMTAAMLAGPNVVLKRFCVVCGFSPRMDECCWYRSNVANLSRYAVRRIRMLTYNPDRDIERLVAARSALAAMVPVDAGLRKTA